MRREPTGTHVTKHTNIQTYKQASKQTNKHTYIHTINNKYIELHDCTAAAAAAAEDSGMSEGFSG